MALENMVGMLNKAFKEHYAVGQFNINNVEWTSAILEEAEKTKTPVILGVTTSAAKYMGGWHTVVGMVKGLMEDLKITVPVALHVDHGPTVKDCKDAIDAGFTSVMIDASHYPLEENIRIVKEVTDYAHSRPNYVSVEAELGRVGGQEDFVVAESAYAIPEECVRLVKETGVDCLAPALGSVHGPYHGEPKLGFKEMKEIAGLVNIPLVLHGGSGIPNDQLRMAIDRGTSKININTECQMAWTKIVREVLSTNDKVYDPRKIIGPGREGIKQVFIDKVTVFGSLGKAE
ncbi:MAG: class II fructose-1,6-bisphosphate aldolase [Bacilli bacterium]|jgi:fructose-1,6-bisphosphate aldolase, class II|nr:fructose-1 6-bisphosphate aldolase class II [Firmicutes bacterium CAG:345]